MAKNTAWLKMNETFAKSNYVDKVPDEFLKGYTKIIELLNHNYFFPNDKQLFETIFKDSDLVKKFFEFLEANNVVEYISAEEMRQSIIADFNKELGEQIVNVKQEQIDKQEKEKVEFEKVINAYNNYCTSLPKVKSLSASRRKQIRERLKDYTIEEIIDCFKVVEESDFLTGRTKNKNNWQANFDWIMCPSNICKIMEGNYNNKTKKGGWNITKFDV